MKANAREYLESYGIRPSLQRLAVMEYLMAHRTHPTADAIFAALAPSIPTLSRTTVYNTLGMLSEKGAILALDIDPKQAHYDGDNSAHAHFLCTECGRIEDIFFDAAALQLFEKARAPQGARVTQMQLTYKGVCPACATRITT